MGNTITDTLSKDASDAASAIGSAWNGALTWVENGVQTVEGIPHSIDNAIKAKTEAIAADAALTATTTVEAKLNNDANATIKSLTDNIKSYFPPTPPATPAAGGSGAVTPPPGGASPPPVNGASPPVAPADPNADKPWWQQLTDFFANFGKKPDPSSQGEDKGSPFGGFMNGLMNMVEGIPIIGPILGLIFGLIAAAVSMISGGLGSIGSFLGGLMGFGGGGQSGDAPPGGGDIVHTMGQGLQKLIGSELQSIGQGFQHGGLGGGSQALLHAATDAGHGIYNIASNPKMAEAINFFVAKGWTKEQSEGIVANLVKESSLNEKADTGDGGLAYGLASWHPDRQAEFKKAFGHDIRSSTYEEQLGFVNYELRKGNETSAGGKLSQAQTAEEAGRIVSQYYERPKEVVAEMNSRGAEATQIDQIVTVASVSPPLPAGQKPNGTHAVS